MERVPFRFLPRGSDAAPKGVRGRSGLAILRIHGSCRFLLKGFLRGVCNSLGCTDHGSYKPG